MSRSSEVRAMCAQLGLPADADAETILAANAAALARAAERRAEVRMNTDPAFRNQVGAAQAEEVRSTDAYKRWAGPVSAGAAVVVTNPVGGDKSNDAEEVRASKAYKNWRSQ